MLAKPDLTQLQQDLLNAADYLDEHGHCIMQLQNEQGNVCLGGALKAAICGKENIYSNVERLGAADLRMSACYKKLAEALGGRGPVDWNDTAGRTKDEVTALLRQAAFE